MLRKRSGTVWRRVVGKVLLLFQIYNFGLKEGREMKRFLIILIVVSAMAALSVIFTQTANSEGRYHSKGAVRSQFFIGLWGGVDPEDGSEVLVSIHNDDDGTLELLWHESRWFNCGGSDNAVLTATGGTVLDGVLSFETAIISCFDMPSDIDVAPYPIKSNRKANTIFTDDISLHRIDSRR